MKKLYLLLSIVLVFASCSSQLRKKVEVSFPNGEPQIARFYNKNDQCVKETEYYQSGQVKMEGTMKDGKREGEWTAYYPDGRVQSHGYFKDGKRTGEATVFWPNGNLREKGFYKEGTHCGHWKWYDEQGFLLREEDYPE